MSEYCSTSAQPSWADYSVRSLVYFSRGMNRLYVLFEWFQSKSTPIRDVPQSEADAPRSCTTPT